MLKAFGFTWQLITFVALTLAFAVQAEANLADGAEQSEKIFIRPNPGVDSIQVQKLKLLNVDIRQGVRAHIQVTVFNKVRCQGRGDSLLTLHGLSHTAASWQRFAEQVLLDSDPECRLGKILAMDLPGHGGSSLPWSVSGVKFGDLTLQDYAQALIGTLDRLKISRLPVNVLLAHSMGGVITQLAQNQLLAQKSSFKRKGVETVVLLASSLPKPLSWNLADSGAGAQLAAPYIKQNIDLGGYAEIPAPNWLGLFFTNFTQQFVLGTPSLSEVQGRGYVALESLTAAGQLLRIQGFPPPQVDQGLFVRQHGTRLVVIAFAQDITVTVDEQKNLYRFLTADADLQSFKTVTGDQAVHDTYISNPRLLFSALQ